MKASSIFDERHYVYFAYTVFLCFSRTEQSRRRHVDFGNDPHRQTRNRSRIISGIHNLASDALSTDSSLNERGAFGSLRYCDRKTYKLCYLYSVSLKKADKNLYLNFQIIFDDLSSCCSLYLVKSNEAVVFEDFILYKFLSTFLNFGTHCILFLIYSFVILKSLKIDEES